MEIYKSFGFGIFGEVIRDEIKKKFGGVLEEER